MKTEQALYLNSITTKSGLTVNPVWFFEKDGSLAFRSMDWVMDTSIPSKWYYDTGLFAKTREEAWEKAKSWASEN